MDDLAHVVGVGGDVVQVCCRVADQAEVSATTARSRDPRPALQLPGLGDTATNRDTQPANKWSAELSTIYHIKTVNFEQFGSSKSTLNINRWNIFGFTEFRINELV